MEMKNTMTDTPLVSVVIPVYNTANSLPCCLETLTAQTYRHLEIIFVDDCSTDTGAEILLRFINSLPADGPISAYIHRHERNRGVAAARNTALENATGKYIYYIDADDKVEADTIGRLVAKAEKEEADIVGCEWFLSYKQNERRMRQPEIVSSRDAFHKMTGGRLRWNLWLFLVKRDLYERCHIRFIEGMDMGEDMMVMGKLFLIARKVVILHTPLYHYMQTNLQSLTKKHSKKNILQLTANVEALEKYVHMEYGNIFDKDMQFLKLNIKLPLLISDNIVNYRTWLQWFPESNPYVLHNELLPLRTRLLQWLGIKKQYWVIWLYYRLVFRFIYGVIYK